MSGGKFFERAKNFFREDLREVIGAYFDGDKIFVVRLTDTLETAEIDADSSNSEHLAEKISLVCRQRGWQTKAVGFCLQEGDAVTYQTDATAVPEKEIPALVKSWATAQTGNDAVFAFMRQEGDVWMETLPRKTVDEFTAAWKKFGMNLRGLSVMPVDMLTKIEPINCAEFIAAIVPIVVATTPTARLVSAHTAIGSAQVLIDRRTASDDLDAAKQSVDALQSDIAIKEAIDADIAEMHRLNSLSAAQNVTPKKFNLLVNVGKATGGGVHLTKIRAEENFLELEGLSATSDAVKSFLSRVKSLVAQNARLERSTEQDDGDIAFVIRATI